MIRVHSILQEILNIDPLGMTVAGGLILALAFVLVKLFLTYGLKAWKSASREDSDRMNKIMTSSSAPCGLCQQPSYLRDSHLLPATLYKLLREPSRPSDPNPVVASPDRAFTSSRQVTSYFLCQNCEQLFSDSERYTQV
jgi:hypothetical protein